MEKKYRILIGVSIALLGVAIMIFSNLQPTNGSEMVSPFDRSGKIMNIARDVIIDLGWAHRSESGGTGGVTITAADLKGKLVTFHFKINLVGTRMAVSTEPDPQYSPAQIVTEVSRRIDKRTDVAPLPKVLVLPP